jgi:hypothetical protein
MRVAGVCCCAEEGGDSECASWRGFNGTPSPSSILRAAGAEGRRDGGGNDVCAPRRPALSGESCTDKHVRRSWRGSVSALRDVIEPVLLPLACGDWSGD